MVWVEQDVTSSLSLSKFITLLIKGVTEINSYLID